ncbi:hypothetical protein ACJRO7_031564 [Eucalyptus globulus]|uniref:Uncharacterized protein n=1 Tax=Eucalyptus globulus TaxID=34317 RepID=A0ABD3JF49_EUCGL
MLVRVAGRLAPGGKATAEAWQEGSRAAAGVAGDEQRGTGGWASGAGSRRRAREARAAGVGAFEGAPEVQTSAVRVRRKERDRGVGWVALGRGAEDVERSSEECCRRRWRGEGAIASRGLVSRGVERRRWCSGQRELAGEAEASDSDGGEADERGVVQWRGVGEGRSAVVGAPGVRCCWCGATRQQRSRGQTARWRGGAALALGRRRRQREEK